VSAATHTDVSGVSVWEIDRQSERAELEASLSPLTADEVAVLDAARSSAETQEEPVAANALEEPSQEEVSFLTKAIQGAVGGSVFTTIKESKFNSQYPSTIGGWTVSAANDDAQNDGFATFQSTWIDQVVSSYTPVVQEKTDTYGRRYFSFDHGINNSLVVVVFEVQGKQMLTIGDTILSLDEFFSLVSCDYVRDDTSKVTGELRFGNDVQNITRFPTHVSCVFPTRTVKITGVNTTTIMSVLTHLSTVFAPQVHSAAEDCRVTVKNDSYSMWAGGLMGAFVSGIVYGAALVSTRYK
jgi:hypothetical protein